MYTHFATIYDTLMEQAPYEEWALFIKQYITKQPSRVIDLGCGSGSVAIALAQSGHSVTGIDLSEDMLVFAQEKARDAHVQVEWVCADMSAIDLGRGQTELIMSTCDSVNYLLNEAAIRSCFEHVYEGLVDGGCFIFDIHSSVQRELFYQYSYTDNGDDISVIWESYGDSDDPWHIMHDLSFFVQRAGSVYTRYNELHDQWLAEPEFYEGILRAIGFTQIERTSDFTNEWSDAGLRTFIRAYK